MHWNKISINLMGNRALLAHEVLLSHILIINSFTTRGMFHKYAFYTIAVFLKGYFVDYTEILLHSWYDSINLTALSNFATFM